MHEYDTTSQESLAVVWEVLILYPYLDGTIFTIRTDHDDLRWTLNISNATGKLETYWLRLSELEFDVVQRAGSKHQAADALSWMPTSGADETTIEDEIPLLFLESHEKSRIQGDNLKESYTLCMD